jgi:hypothetical protein
MTSIADDTVYTLAKSVSFQPLGQGEGAVVLLVGSGDVFTCNDTTSAFLRTLDGKTTFAETVDALAQTFDVAKAVLRADLENLAGDLAKQGIIV